MGDLFELNAAERTVLAAHGWYFSHPQGCWVNDLDSHTLTDAEAKVWLRYLQQDGKESTT